MNTFFVVVVVAVVVVRRGGYLEWGRGVHSLSVFYYLVPYADLGSIGYIGD